MNNNSAKALSHSGLIALKEALDHADTPDDFFAEADSIVNNPANLLQLRFDSGVPQSLEPGSRGDNGRDVDNAPLVYEFLGAMDRSNAADRRLWTFLAFSTYRDYMEKRWPPSEVRNWKSRVTDRWIMTNATRGKLVRHGIARLWWVASLTHDPKCGHLLSAGSDPFAYTREAFKNEDRIIQIFDREAGANPTLVRSVLEHAAQGESYATDKHLAALMKELTLVYGYRDIGVLDPVSTRTLITQSAPTITPEKDSVRVMVSGI